MGRRRQHTINTQTWEPAITHINRMERAMVNVMVKPGDLTHDHVLECMVQPDILKLLRDAYQHTSASLGESSKEFDHFGAKVTFVFDYTLVKCLSPKRSLMQMLPEAPHYGQLVELCKKLVHITSQHRKLRRILSTFTNLNVTAGAAKHYWPTLQSLLPSDHDFFKVKGDRFKDVALPYETQELLREAPEIIAKGLLCDPNVNGRIDTGTRSIIRMNVDGGQYFYLFNAPKGA